MDGTALIPVEQWPNHWARADIHSLGVGFIDRMIDGEKIVECVYGPDNIRGVGKTSQEAWDNLKTALVAQR